MQNKDELTEIDIKNCSCLFFMILLDFGKEMSILLILYKTKSYIKKKNENILIYEISYKTSAGAKLLCIRFDKVGGFIKLHDKVVINFVISLMSHK